MWQGLRGWIFANPKSSIGMAITTSTYLVAALKFAIPSWKMSDAVAGQTIDVAKLGEARTGFHKCSLAFSRLKPVPLFRCLTAVAIVQEAECARMLGASPAECIGCFVRAEECFEDSFAIAKWCCGILFPLTYLKLKAQHISAIARNSDTWSNKTKVVHEELKQLQVWWNKKMPGTQFMLRFARVNSIMAADLYVALYDNASPSSVRDKLLAKAAQDVVIVASVASEQLPKPTFMFMDRLTGFMTAPSEADEQIAATISDGAIGVRTLVSVADGLIKKQASRNDVRALRVVGNFLWVVSDCDIAANAFSCAGDVEILLRSLDCRLRIVELGDALETPQLLTAQVLYALAVSKHFVDETASAPVIRANRRMMEAYERSNAALQKANIPPEHCAEVAIVTARQARLGAKTVDVVSGEYIAALEDTNDPRTNKLANAREFSAFLRQHDRVCEADLIDRLYPQENES